MEFVLLFFLTQSYFSYAIRAGTSNDKLDQKPLQRSFDYNIYFQKRENDPKKLLEELDTLPTTDPPDIFDSIPSFLTKPKPSTKFPTPNENLLTFSSSIPEEIPYGYFGPGFKYNITNIPKHTYVNTFSPIIVGDLDHGQGTWLTWVTTFHPTSEEYSTKSTRRTLRPDPLTAPRTTRITTTETEYNPVKGWYDREITNPKYFLHSYKTENPIWTARRRIKSSDFETSSSILGITGKRSEDKNTNLNH